MSVTRRRTGVPPAPHLLFGAGVFAARTVAGGATPSREFPEEEKMLRRLQSLFVKPGPMTETINANIHLYIETLSRFSFDDLDDFSDELVRQGLTVDMAERLIAFVPEAFVRVVLARHDFGFLPGYVIYDVETDQKYRFLLKDVPVFVAATALAKSLAIDDPMLIAVASCSPAGQIVGDLKNSASFRRLNFTETLFTRLPLPKKPS